MSKDEEKLSFKNIVFSGLGLDLGNGLKGGSMERSLLSIFQKDDQVISNFQGNIYTENLSKSVLGLREENNNELNFLAGSSNLILDINWEGLPNQFDINKIQRIFTKRIRIYYFFFF